MSLKPVFCCEMVEPIEDLRPRRFIHPNHEIHLALFDSFLRSACQRQVCAPLLEANGIDLETGFAVGHRSVFTSKSPLWNNSRELQIALENNPLTAETPYLIYVNTRKDFGKSESWRYFACPPIGSSLNVDWIEVCPAQHFATGYPFKVTVDKLDLRCVGPTQGSHEEQAEEGSIDVTEDIEETDKDGGYDEYDEEEQPASHEKFFRIELRANENLLGLRSDFNKPIWWRFDGRVLRCQ